MYDGVFLSFFFWGGGAMLMANRMSGLIQAMHWHCVAHVVVWCGVAKGNLCYPGNS